MKKQEIEKKLKSSKVLTKQIFNYFITFGDLDRKFQDLNAYTGNIYCPFHPHEFGRENTGKPSAKVYFSESSGIYTIRCFNTGRNYSAFDYC